MQKVRTIYTLGPEGTNCEAAAYKWLEDNDMEGRVTLLATIEEAADSALKDPEGALLACIVYPDLHNVVFQNLKNLTLSECFVMPTYNMVLAAKSTAKLKTIATHPAPSSLIKNTVVEVRLVTSNSVAAAECADGIVDGCITTSAAASKFNLKIIEDFGPVPMGFSIHLPRLAT